MAGRLADPSSRPIEIAGGSGCFVTDARGKRYLDFTAGWCVGNVGWKRREVVAAIRAAAGREVYVAPFLRSRVQEEFADLLVSIAPGRRLARAIRCTSGSEAVEFAIKCARAATGKPTIVSVDGVYHGHTYAAASVGDACSGGMAPCVPGMIKLPMPQESRGVAAKTVVEEFARLARERDDIAAFLSEPAWTNAGAVIPPPDFYPAIQEICRKRGILLVMDEVATGFGRTGMLFGSALWGLAPDILCLGKGLTGGCATLGACLVSERVYRRSRHIPWYSTFGWLPQDLAAARANVEVLLRERLWENARTVGARLLGRLTALEGRAGVREVRGTGLLLGVELGGPAAFLRARRIQDRAASRGLLVETAGSALFLTPPLVLSRALADRGADILLGLFGVGKGRGRD